MATDRSIDFLDYVLIILKRKWKLLGIALSILIISYLLIYFFVEERFEAKAVIIPSEDDQLSSLSSMFKGLSNLPLGLGALKKDTNIDLYITIIYSRTNLDAIIEEFDLYREYNLNSMEKTRKVLAKNIKTKETKEGAFEISVIASSREKSAAMTNFVVEKLNENIIDLNIRKSKENRAFLEKRYEEIKITLRDAEDSLRHFQEKTRVLVADEQTKAIIETFSKLESEIAAKEIETNIYERMHGKNSPITQNAQISLEEFRSKLKSLRRGEGDSSFLISLSSIPKYSMEYYRLYRDVMINSTMLEVIIPLYETAKFQEQKETPILQIIDLAEPPELKAYPQRVLSALLITIAIMSFILLYLFFSDFLKNSLNPKIILLRKELRFRKNK
ncbi:MAG: hypothetical protein KGZ85_16365 [Ignavibacterium sp.]|nr:hypothetical protein [Ignavibacterium sp.]